jgi:hypothetical protein
MKHTDAAKSDIIELIKAIQKKGVHKDGVPSWLLEECGVSPEILDEMLKEGSIKWGVDSLVTLA